MKPAEPLDILFLNYEFPPIGGGAGTGSKYLARDLARQGHRVLILTSAFKKLKKIHEQSYPSGGSLCVQRIPVLRKEAGRCRPHEMASYMISAFFQLFRLKKKPDAIVSFHSIPSGVPGWPHSVLRGIPHIVLFRGGDVPGFLPEDLKTLHTITYPLNWLIVKQAKASLANSVGLQKLAQNAFPKADVGVLENGVDSLLFRPSNEPHENEETHFLFAGRMTNQKGLDTLVDALGLLKKRHPKLKWKATLVGDGPLMNSLQISVKELKISEQVNFPGWLERTALAKLYRKSDVFVFPSRYEGMPNAVLEAMSSGLAIITTPIAGCEDLIDDAEQGLITPVDDVAQLAEKMFALATDQVLRTQLGDNGRRRVVEDYSWESRAEQLAEVIRTHQA